MTTPRPAWPARIHGLLLCLAAAACTPESAGVVRASGVTVYAPLPGQDTAVAYLTLHNDTAAPVTVTAVTSDEFGDVEMHETRLADGVSTMVELESLEIAAGEEAVFEPGGRHLMLIAPRDALGAGARVTLRIHGEAGPILELAAELEERSASLPNDGTPPRTANPSRPDAAAASSRARRSS